MSADILAALSHVEMAVKHYEDAKELLAKHGINLAEYTFKTILVSGGIDKLAEETGEEPILTDASRPCKTIHHNGVEYFQYAKPKIEEYTWS